MERDGRSRVFSYSPIPYCVSTLLLAGLVLLLPILLVVIQTSWADKVFTLIVLGPVLGGLWHHTRRRRRRPWTIRVTRDGITGESRTGEVIGLSWQEIGRIDGPPPWESILDTTPRIILRSPHGDRALIIGKNVRDYKDLAHIIKANTPHCSHDQL